MSRSDGSGPRRHSQAGGNGLWGNRSRSPGQDRQTSSRTGLRARTYAGSGSNLCWQRSARAVILSWRGRPARVRPQCSRRLLPSAASRCFSWKETQTLRRSWQRSITVTPRTCLSFSRFRRVAGLWQPWLDVPSDQVLRGQCGWVWLGDCGRWQSLRLPIGPPSHPVNPSQCGRPSRYLPFLGSLAAVSRLAKRPPREAVMPPATWRASPTMA